MPGQEAMMTEDRPLLDSNKGEAAQREKAELDALDSHPQRQLGRV
jgi:hypothetical protein